eukprot:625254-Hanusia_phi.AAC.1
MLNSELDAEAALSIPPPPLHPPPLAGVIHKELISSAALGVSRWTEGEREGVRGTGREQGRAGGSSSKKARQGKGREGKGRQEDCGGDVRESRGCRGRMIVYPGCRCKLLPQA